MTACQRAAFALSVLVLSIVDWPTIVQAETSPLRREFYGQPGNSEFLAEFLDGHGQVVKIGCYCRRCRFVEFATAGEDCRGGARGTISVDRPGVLPGGEGRERGEGEGSVLAEPRSDRRRQPVAPGTVLRDGTRGLVRRPAMAVVAKESRSDRRRQSASKRGRSGRAELGQHRRRESRARRRREFCVPQELGSNRRGKFARKQRDHRRDNGVRFASGSSTHLVDNDNDSNNDNDNNNAVDEWSASSKSIALLPTDRELLERFVKRNIDEIDRTAFDNFFKRNLDEIGRVGWNGFVKRLADYLTTNRSNVLARRG